MSPFSPKGEVARWRIVYRILQETPVGATLTYEQVADALDLHPQQDRARIQTAVRRAGKQFLKVDDRAIEVVPDVGYRAVSAERHIPLAGDQVQRAVKTLEKGRDLTVHVRLDELSPEGRTIVHAMALGFSQVAEYARQMTRRVENHEDRLNDIEEELARLRNQRTG